MEVSISSLSEVLQEAEIQVSDGELQPHFEEAYGKEREKMEIKGFRKGKAPMSIIKRLYGEAIEHKALDRVASDFYRKAMDEREIHPIGQPSMIDMDYKRGDSFRFKIQYEVRPEILVRGYKGLKVVKPLHTIQDSEVDAEILRLRRINSSTEDAPAVTDDEHIVTADIQELDQVGTPLIGRKKKDIRFYLADEGLSGEIKQVLKNAEVGGTYRTRFEAEEKENRPPMEVALNVSRIEKVVLPTLDDDFVEKLTKGKGTSVDEFTKKLRTDIEQYWADWSKKKLADAIGAEIVKAHDFPVPESLINSIMDSYIEDIRNKSQDGSLPREFDEDKFRHDSRDLAVWQAKWMLLKEGIAEKEDLRVTDEELSARATKEAERMGLPAEKVLEFYGKSAGAREQLLSEKIMDFLISHAKITEKEAEG